MILKRIADWLNNQEKVSQYRNGMQELSASGVLLLLQRLAIPNRIKQGADVNVMASEASFCSGYQTCLEHLTYFVEIFSKETVRTVVPDFGGTEQALNRGLLRPDELKKDEV